MSDPSDEDEDLATEHSNMEVSGDLEKSSWWKGVKAPLEWSRESGRRGPEDNESQQPFWGVLL